MKVLLLIFCLIFSSYSFALDRDQIHHDLVSLSEDDDYLSNSQILIVCHHLDRYLQKEGLSKKEQVWILLTYAGYSGVYARKNTSAQHAKKSYQYLERAVELDPHHSQAVKYYAETILEFTKVTTAEKIVVELGLRIKIEEKRIYVLRLLRDLPQDKETEYFITQLTI